MISESKRKALVDFILTNRKLPELMKHAIWYEIRRKACAEGEAIALLPHRREQNGGPGPPYTDDAMHQAWPVGQLRPARDVRRHEVRRRMVDGTGHIGIACDVVCFPPRNVEETLRPRGGGEVHDVDDSGVVVRARKHARLTAARSCNRMASRILPSKKETRRLIKRSSLDCSSLCHSLRQ